MSEGLVRAEQVLRRSCGERVRRDFVLAPLTTFRIGGPAALFLEPRSVVDLEAVSRAYNQTGTPVVVLGKGSNVLISDAGIRGIVIRLGEGFRWTGRDGDLLSAGAATPLPALASTAYEHSLSGLEFATTIPALFGGAVRMNAGAPEGSIGDLARSVEVFLLDAGSVATIPASRAGFGYRSSSLPGIVIAASLGLHPGTRGEIGERMREAREWRRATQPMGEPNCGSVFRNPPGDHAARMIEEVGGKEMSVGSASVSRKHTNFIVAAEGATASDVLTLIERVQERVEDVLGVRLEREVHLLGDFGGA